jgi:hypothetical protein
MGWCSVAIREPVARRSRSPYRAALLVPKVRERLHPDDGKGKAAQRGGPVACSERAKFGSRRLTGAGRDDELALRHALAHCRAHTCVAKFWAIVGGTPLPIWSNMFQ